MKSTSSVQPGKPTQNAFIERFNGTCWRGVLDKCLFEDLNQVREETEMWIENYNDQRPHDWLIKIALVTYTKIHSPGANRRRMKNVFFGQSGSSNVLLRTSLQREEDLSV